MDTRRHASKIDPYHGTRSTALDNAAMACKTVGTSWWSGRGYGALGLVSTCQCPTACQVPSISLPVLASRNSHLMQRALRGNMTRGFVVTHPDGVLYP